VESVLQHPVGKFGAGGLGLRAVADQGDGRQGCDRVDIDAASAGAVAAGALGAVTVRRRTRLRQIAAKAGGPVYAAIDLAATRRRATGFDCLAKGGKQGMVGCSVAARPWALDR